MLRTLCRVWVVMMTTQVWCFARLPVVVVVVTTAWLVHYSVSRLLSVSAVTSAVDVVEVFGAGALSVKGALSSAWLGYYCPH